LSTSLLHTERFTITRQTRNKRWVENTGLNNAFNIFKITKLDEGIIFFRNKVLYARQVGQEEHHKSTLNLLELDA
jgi:hypothetical protein